MAELIDMALFVQTVQAGSLSAAGRQLGVSPAVASKRLTRLESQLGVRLLHRNSRSLAPTDEGALYFERCQAILGDVAEAESQLAQGRAAPHGTLRVSATTALGRRWVGPVAAQFSTRYPEVTVKLSLTEQVVDVVDAGLDCAVRVGAVPDSRLIVRKLADNRRVVCATPAYLRRYGRPQHPADLKQHNCIILTTADLALSAEWAFAGPLGEVKQPVSGRLVTDNGQQAHDWMLAGHGLARRSLWDVDADIAEGRLVEVLGSWSQLDAPISVVYPSRRFLPSRTRLFVDALANHFAKAAKGLTAVKKAR